MAIESRLEKIEARLKFKEQPTAVTILYEPGDDIDALIEKNRREGVEVYLVLPRKGSFNRSTDANAKPLSPK